MLAAATFPDGAAVAEQPALVPFARALARASDAAHVAGMAASTVQAPLLAPAGDGWALGRYAGHLTLDGLSVAIEPRIGWDALAGWVVAATGLHEPPGGARDGQGRLSALAAMLWVRAVDGASRHGPPAFRRDVAYVGGNVRGHLDVRSTVRLRAKGASTAASVYRARELDNPVTRIIVAADRVLVRQVGQGRWRTDRVDDVLAQLKSAVGRRSPAPGDGELHRMRYTPITRPFKWAAELSSRIVRQDAIATTPLPGRVQGLVLDLDTIYGEAALNWARAARPDLRADRVDSGQIVLRDRHRARGNLVLLPPAPGGAAAGLVLSGPVSERLELPADAAAAATMVSGVLAGI